jgi:hypothetical protein
MSNASSFTKQQPKHGDTIMHCGHVGDGKMHWFQYETPVQFVRPDRSRGEAEWFAACDSCFGKHGEKVVKFVRGDNVWTGDAPIIENEEN